MKKKGKSAVYSDRHMERMRGRVPSRTLPCIHKLAGIHLKGMIEATPVVFGGRLLTIGFCRDASHGTGVRIHDLVTRALVREFPWDYGLGCALVAGDAIHLFGSTDWERPGNAIYTSILDAKLDPVPGSTRPVFEASPDRQIYNTSVSGPSPLGHVMAYELREPGAVPFSVRFLRSPDLAGWAPVGTIFRPDIYAACPTVRYCDGWFYIIYLEHRVGYVECISRTRDFEAFEHFAGNGKWGEDAQVLSPKYYPDEGINNSDMDLVEHGGITYIVYADGDQRTFGDMRTAVYLGTVADFFKEFWQD